MASPGETRLELLLADLRPVLRKEPYVFVMLPAGQPANIPNAPLATFHEQEGLSVILRQAEADDLGYHYNCTWACITLNIHSSLGAVGFLAALLPPLAKAGISVNPVSAYHHDHLFVPWERREEALNILLQPLRGVAP